MKNIKIRHLARSLVVVLSLFLLGLSTSQAQIGPSLTTPLGIYGSVPTDYRANTVYVHVEPNDTDNAIGYTIPVNGRSNFNLYYTHDGNGFLPGEHYTVSYLDSSKSLLGYEVVNYTPNAKYTTGTQASTAFNNPPSTPRGIHGYVLARIPGGGGATAPLYNAVAQVGDNQVYFNRVRTNGDGYFSIYYSTQYPGQFLAPNSHYDLRISGTQDGCFYFWEETDWAIWFPDEGYIYGAEWDNDTVTLTGQGTNCQP